MPDIVVLPQLLDLQLGGPPSGQHAPEERAPRAEDAAVDGHLAAIAEGDLGVREEVEVAAAALGGEDGPEVVGEADEGGRVGGRGRAGGGGVGFGGGGGGGRGGAVDAAAVAVAGDVVGVG